MINVKREVTVKFKFERLWESTFHNHPQHKIFTRSSNLTVIATTVDTTRSRKTPKKLQYMGCYQGQALQPILYIGITG